MDVKLISITQFINPQDVPWTPDPEIPDSSGENLIEYAGRNCYLSWSNPGKKTNEEYIAHILEVGHLSVIEHVAVTFSLAGVSRSLTHELVRHRHFSFSQESQRYCDEADTEFVDPPTIANQYPDLLPKLRESFEASKAAYKELVEEITKRLKKDYPELTVSDRRKMARGAARAVLPNATSSRIVVSGNLRAWRWFLLKRGSRLAEIEIRNLAYEVYKILYKKFPHIFKDFKTNILPDGTLELVSELTE